MGKDKWTSTKWYRQNKERARVVRRALQRRTRKLIIETYGGKCACCAESTFEFLALDHVNNDGNVQRKISGRGLSALRWIINHNFPDSIQILCHNCNSAKAYYGICPHKTGGMM